MKPLDPHLRLISFLTMFLAVVLATIALFVLDSKNLARVVFVVVLVTGYGYIFIQWKSSR